MEYALNTHPLQAEPSSLTVDSEWLNGERYIRLTIPKNPAATNLLYTVETCDIPGHYEDGMKGFIRFVK